MRRVIEIAHLFHLAGQLPQWGRDTEQPPREGFDPQRAPQVAQCSLGIRSVAGPSQVGQQRGQAPGKGDIWINNPLAATLEKIGREGRDVFYKGEMAQVIAQTVQDAGGFLTAEDLANHRSEWVDPVKTD